MERYIDYKIKSGKSEDLSALWGKIRNADYSGGPFSVSSEKTFNDDTLVIICKLPEYPKSRLIIGKSSEDISILNVVPTKESGIYELSKEEYNYILKSFVERIITPLLEIYTGFSVDETPSTYCMEDLIPQSYDKLHLWISNSPLSHHTFDTERWFDFLIALVDNGEELSSENLEKYLCEQNWDEDDIQSQTLKYEEEIELLLYARKSKYNSLNN